MMEENPGPNIADELQRRLTPEIFDKLVGYAIQKAGGHPFRGAQTFGIIALADEIVLPDGLSPADIVMDIFRKILNSATGQKRDARRWNPDEDLFEFVSEVIDSEFSHVWEKLGRLKKRDIVVMRESALFSDNESEVQATLRDFPAEEHERYLERLSIKLDRWLLKEFRRFLDENGQGELSSIVECFSAGIDSPQEISEYIGVPVKTVYAANKRMARQIDAFRARLTESESLAKNRGGKQHV